MEQISLFDKSSSQKHTEVLSVRSFLKRVKSGYWQKAQDKVQKAKDKKKVKQFQTPCVTICGVFNNKRVGQPDKHSGYICIDVDGKDNKLLMKKRELLEDDPFIFAVFSSIGGDGLALIFKIKPKKHRELFIGIQDYLYKEYSIIVDPLAKDPARLRYVSSDPECYSDFSKKQFEHAVITTPVPSLGNVEHNEKDLVELLKRIDKQKLDIAPNYHEWYTIGQALAQLGKKGREYFHTISKQNPQYDKKEVDTQFDNCLNQESKGMRDDRVGLSSVFFFAKEAGIVIASDKAIEHKKTIVDKHEENVMLCLDGVKLDKITYTYHIWAFRLIFKKDEQTDVQCLGLNHEAVSDFLFNKGYRRSGKTFYNVQKNIVEVVSIDSILDRVVQEGVKLPKNFSIAWDEESNHVIRKNILNSVQQYGKKTLEREIILKEFIIDDDEFLRDTQHSAYLYFKNCIVHITKSGHKVLDYESVDKYIWKDTIIDKDFKYVKKKSLIQTILENAIGKEYWNNVQSALGYMLHTFIFGEGSEMLFCIDRNVGDTNEGGNGKDFVRQIIQNIRKTANIPGKSLNLNHQFAWETVDRDTQVVWIEDLGKHIKMEQLYNLNNGINVRRMHTQPFTVKCKTGISLQHLINIEGTSDQRRQIFILFTDFYSQRDGIGKFHKDRDIFGKTWTGWDEYHSMIVNCMQYYLKKGVIKMDMSELLERRVQELSEGSFENLQPGTWYSTEGAIKLCWGEDTVITTETFIAFRKKLSQWAKLMGYEVEAERKSIDKVQQKAIRIMAPMKIVSSKKK